MSSGKLTKRQRACDFCRKRKIRCQPSESDAARCSSCVEFGINSCTFIAPTGRAEPTFAYAEKLEKRLKSLELLVKRFTRSGKSTPSTPERVTPDPARVLDVCLLTAYGPHGAPLPAQDDAFFKNSAGRYFGRSSLMPLLGLASEVKEEAGGDPLLPAKPVYEEDPEQWTPEMQSGSYMTSLVRALPDDASLVSLLEIYFRCVSPFWPFIHRPTVEAQCADLSHYRQPSQAKLILMICAVASVHTPEASNTYGKPPGWAYFAAVHDTHQDLIPEGAPKLVDVQVIALQAFYYFMTSAPHSAWVVLGTGIRSAQEVGVHQSSFMASRRPLEAEMWKRVFWFFVALDRFICSFLGQTEMIREEHIDLALPKRTLLEDGASHSEYFRCSLQLAWLHSFASRSTSAKQPWFKVLNITTKDDIILTVEALIERWLIELPEHLRWDAKRRDPINFEQSAELQISLATLKIFVHKPWAAAVPMSAISPMSNKDVAGNAAQFCCEVADTLYSRNPLFISVALAHGLAISVVVLQTRLWAVRKRTDVPAATATKLKAVYERSLENMKIISRRWPPAGRIFQIVDRAVHGNTQIKMLGSPSSQCSRTKQRLEDTLHEETRSSTTPPPSSSAGVMAHPTWELVNKEVGSADSLYVTQADEFPLPVNLFSWEDIIKNVQMGYGDEMLYQDGQFGDGQDTVWANQLIFPSEWDETIGDLFGERPPISVLYK